jgi:hypothetical protein
MRRRPKGNEWSSSCRRRATISTAAGTHSLDRRLPTEGPLEQDAHAVRGLAGASGPCVALGPGPAGGLAPWYGTQARGVRRKCT